MLVKETTTKKRLKAEEIAEQLGVSLAWVYRHSTGPDLPMIPHIKMHRTVRYLQADVDEYLENCRTDADNGSTGGADCVGATTH